MLTEEFFKEWPNTVFHGVHHQDGTVVAEVTNPMVRDGYFALGETCLYNCIQQGRAHQSRLPMDTRNRAELVVLEKALVEVQIEKRRSELPLDAPVLQGPFILTVIPGGREPG